MKRPLLLDLPKGRQTIIDESDWQLVKHLTLYVGTNGYVYFSVWRNGRPETLHSLLMGKHSGKHVDHINGDKLDNRRENLRVVTPQQNQINRKKANRNNTSGVRGVCYQPKLCASNPWHAQIMANRRGIHLGLFATKEEAVAARRQAEVEYFGEECP